MGAPLVIFLGVCMEKFSLERALSLESKYDDSLQTRPIGDWLAKFVLWFSVLFALYHYVTAGIGVPVDFWHMGAQSLNRFCGWACRFP